MQRGLTDFCFGFPDLGFGFEFGLGFDCVESILGLGFGFGVGFGLGSGRVRARTISPKLSHPAHVECTAEPRLT